MNSMFLFACLLSSSNADLVPTPLYGIEGVLSGCPSGNDSAPFLRTPRIEFLGPCRDGSAEANCASTTAKTWKHTFHRAARFSIPRYGQQQQPIEQDGLLIYEGMTLTVNPETGVYDLNFTATAPPTTVTVRMQLQFSHKNINDSGKDPIRLTLPPITIESDSNTKPGDGSGTTLKVNHRGYSELFLNPKNNSRSTNSDLKLDPAFKSGNYQIDSNWKIIRAGSARFGSGSANADDTNR